MRRRLAAATVASLTVASVSTISAVSAVTSEANAAGRTWTTRAGYPDIAAGGTYSFYKDKHNKKRIRMDGWLRDKKENGWAAGVQFQTTKPGKIHRSKVYFFRSGKLPADYDYTKNEKYGLFFTSDYLSHFYVRECGVRSNKYRTKKCGKWQKVY
ncbi:hypothetical protein ACGFNU_23230 [Spirillospora sp. NPDC048911]|uniref:hypothetical protein n=1 Tax=Spirillospora sp. NPDC048911 TaxID=3364527 RepID=UPI00371FADD2